MGFQVGQQVHIKRGARLFYNFGASSLRYDKKKDWIINQVPEKEGKEQKKCYTKKVHFDGTVEISDPEIVYANDMVFCKITINDEVCHILAADLYAQKEKPTTPAKEWNIS